MNDDHITAAAQRVAAQEQAVQSADAEAKHAQERLANLYQRQSAIDNEIRSTRADRTVDQVTSAEAARIHLLSMDAADLLPIIEAAIKEAQELSARLNSESMALDVARRDFSKTVKVHEIKAVEEKIREAEAVMMNGIIHLRKLKQEAGMSFHGMSDIYRPSNQFDRMIRMGAFPTEGR